MFLMAATPIAHAEKMTFTIEQMLTLSSGLNGLNGYEQVVKEGERERSVRRVFDFAPGTIMAIVKDALAIEGALKPFNTTRQQIISAINETDAAKPEDQRNQELYDKLKPILAEHHEVDLTKLKASELKLDKNPIPISAMVALAPIVEDDGK